jgi:ABC-2 type transport system ATP-binding protein
MTECAIEAVALRKSFKGHKALCGLNLTVPRGSVFGFLGRNGAGKTTTIRILMGPAKADQGTARIFGIAPGDDDSGALLRRRIGFVPEDKELYPYMTVEEIIRFSRPFFPHWRDDLERRYLKTFDLPLKKKIPDLSKGMRSKLMLLLAIARGSELLILDGPTDGLDPVVAEEVLRELIVLAASDDHLFLFSSIGGSGADGRSNHDHRPGPLDYQWRVGRSQATVPADQGCFCRRYPRRHSLGPGCRPHPERGSDGLDPIRTEQ